MQKTQVTWLDSTISLLGVILFSSYYYLGTISRVTWFASCAKKTDCIQQYHEGSVAMTLKYTANLCRITPLGINE